MEIEQLKKLFQNFYTMQTQVRFLERHADIEGSEGERVRYLENKRTVEILADMLNILDDEERFIIQTHLISRCTWTETTELFSKKFGYEKEKSERTLKRFQNKALRKMLEVSGCITIG